MRRGSVVAALLLLAPCIASAEDPEGFATVGEGCTSESRGANLMVAWRMFTTVEGPCELRDLPFRLEATQRKMSGRVGVPFQLQELRVVALDSAGKILPPLPIWIEVQTKHFDLERYIAQNDGIVPRSTGAYTIRIRAMSWTKDLGPTAPVEMIELEVK